MNLYVLETAALFAAALILIASLAWNDAVASWFEQLRVFPNLLLGKFVYAIVFTLIAAGFLVWLKPFQGAALSKRDEVQKSGLPGA
jgi:membrane protein implicated in regulation of membrane protease activity